MNIILKILKLNNFYKKIFFIITFIFSLLLIIFSMNFKELLYNKEIYSCNLKQNIDYNVEIFPNSVFDTTVLPSNTTYISKLVDDINVEYNYTHSSELSGNLDLYYTVNATTLIIENSEKNNENIASVPSIRKKEHILKNKEKISSTDNKTASVSDNIIIDYDTYIKEVEEFKKDIYKLSYSALLLDFKVEAVKYLADGTSVLSTTTGNVKIPLDEESFLITTGFTANEKKTHMQYANPTFYVNYALLIVGCILLILDGTLFYLNKTFYYKYFLKSPENVKLEKFLFEFKDVIIKSKEQPSFSNKNKVVVNDFSELSNLYHLIKRPIIYYKTTSPTKIINNYFCVDFDDTIYVFIFKTSYNQANKYSLINFK